MNQPQFEKKYLGPLSAIIDWVAGGNFDGYVYRQSIVFHENDNSLTARTKILDQSRYDDQRNDSERKGTYSFTDKNTITCQIGQLSMRGKILGENARYIAFSYLHPHSNEQESICFELEEKPVNE